LFFVWPIPHTTTIRISLLILSLFLAIFLFVKQGSFSFKALRELRIPVVLYFAFTVWICLSAIFISEKTLWSLDEINGQWLRGGMGIAIGALFAHLPGRSSLPARKKIFLFIFGVLVLHTVLVVIQGVYKIWQSSEFFSQNLTFVTRHTGGLLAGPIEAGCLIDILMSIIIVEIILRIVYAKRFLPASNALLVILSCLIIFASYITGFRNFLELSALLFFAACILFLSKGGFKRNPIRFIIFIAVVLSLNIAIFFSDERWQNLFETMPLAFDTKAYAANEENDYKDLPRLKSGERVNISNYIRLAQFKEGLYVISENPWGVGFGRDAFRHGIERTYGFHVGSHSDSGLINLTIGAGIVGLILWVAFILSLIVISFKRFITYKNYYALVLCFISISFALRMVIDPIIKDHKLHQFLFLVGLLSISMLIEGNSDSSEKAEDLTVL